MNGNTNTEYSEKVILITGASSGIGACTAKNFAQLGAKLSLTGRNEENLLNAVKICKENGCSDVITTICDLTNDENIPNIITNTIKHFGRLNILINNAGIYETDTIQKGNLEKFDRILNTNLRSIYLLTHLATPHLIASKGNIVNVSSFSGIRAIPWSLSYSMSKAALDQFTKCVALELASKGVRVNSVNPGTTITGIQKRAGLSDEQIIEFVEKCKVTHPLGRPGYPEDVAKAIVFLTSDKANFITGVLLPVDGGRHVAPPK